jgi:hypothetical protein
VKPVVKRHHGRAECYLSVRGRSACLGQGSYRSHVPEKGRQLPADVGFASAWQAAHDQQGAAGTGSHALGPRGRRNHRRSGRNHRRSACPLQPLLQPTTTPCVPRWHLYPSSACRYILVHFRGKQPPPHDRNLPSCPFHAPTRAWMSPPGGSKGTESMGFTKHHHHHSPHCSTYLSGQLVHAEPPQCNGCSWGSTHPLRLSQSRVLHALAGPAQPTIDC